MTSYKDFPIKFVDVSSWNDDPTTTYFPDVKKVAAAGFRGIGVRVSYGQATDRAFWQFWTSARGILDRMPYVWLHMAPPKGITYYQWGVLQAKYAYTLLKDDRGELKLALDVENGGGVVITLLNQSRIGEIIRGFLDTWKELSGQDAAIYTNQGYMFVFGVVDHGRDLWLSWYNRGITLDQIKAMLIKKNWTGKLLFWQYTSDGDINDDGISDGLVLGMEDKSLDLNDFIGSEEEYKAIRLTASTVTPAPTPLPEPPVQPSAHTATVIALRGVVVRSGVGTNNPQVGNLTLAYGTQRPVLESGCDAAGNLWVRVAEGWICVQLRGWPALVKVS